MDPGKTIPKRMIPGIQIRKTRTQKAREIPKTIIRGRMDRSPEIRRKP